MKHFNWMRRAGCSVLAVALSLAMAIPSASFSAIGAAAADTFYYGDVDEDGTVAASDALLVLMDVVKLTPITDETALALAEMNGDGQITALDALQILKTVVGLEDLRAYQAAAETDEPAKTTAPAATATPKATATPTAQPTIVPAPTAAVVTADPSNIVTGEPVEVEELNGALYDEESGIYTYVGEVNGIEAANPLSGHYELREVAADLLAASTAEPDHDLVWDLPGASMVKADLFPDESDPRVTNFYAPEAGYEDPKGEFPAAEKGVTYTRPEWTQGVSFSFWAKSQDEDGRDTAPALSLFNDNFVFVVRLNGTVYFEDYQDSENYFDMRTLDASSYNEWNYYTVTVKNDWVQVYVNGEEIFYQQVDMNRKKMGSFNDGFLTRYNADGDCSIDLTSDLEHYTYYTLSGAYYYNDEYSKWMTHDNYTVFGNSRYRGVGAGSTLMIDYLTSGTTQMFIGGTSYDEYTDDNMIQAQKYGSQVADVEYYLVELTAAQVKANYEAATKPADIAVPTQGPSEEPTQTPSAEPTESAEPTPTPEPDAPVEGTAVSLSTKKSGTAFNESGTTTIDETTGLITFNTPVPNGDGNCAGVVYADPAAGNTNITSTMNEALEGQYIIPDSYFSNGVNKKEDYYLHAADGTVLLDADGNPRVAIAGARDAVQSWRNNYKDVYYGELDESGITTDSLTGEKTGNRFDINNPGDDVKVTTFARPVWTTGMSYSFWYKPTADESYTDPILTFYKSKSYVFYMDVKGSVFFTCLKTDTNNWFKEETFLTNENAKPYNCFAAVGDEANVNLGEWNYYTVTFANDMITVYINGKEAVYKELNLNRGDMKTFNGGFLTRYNTIGLAFVGDDTDSHQYLTKSGYLQEKAWDTQVEFRTYGDKSDSLSIRSNNRYENLNADLAANDSSNSAFPDMMMDLFANGTGSGNVILGGYDVAPMTAENMVHDVTTTDADGNTVTTTAGWYLNSLGSSVRWCTDYVTPAGAQAYDLEFYEVELTAGNVKANYEKALVDDAEVLGLTAN